MKREAGIARLVLPVGERDHIQGLATAPVTLVEYCDYECSHCGQAYPIVKRIKKLGSGSLRFIFRNFPLTESHPHAAGAAEAAEAAAAQGKFWEMHDYLFEHQRALDDENLKQYAAALGLDAERFNREMAEHTYAARVEEDFLSGLESGVKGTPTFFINGLRHNGPWDFETLLKEIEAAMQGRGK